MKRRPGYWWSSASVVAAVLAGPVAAAVQAGGIEAPAGVEDALLSVSINGAPAGEPVALVKGAGGTFYVPADVLASWRLNPASRPALTRDGESYHLLNSIPGIKLELDPASQTLNITARPEVLATTRLAYANAGTTDELVRGNGGFLNYDATAQLAEGATSLGGAMEAGLFSSLGVGITGFVGNWSGEGGAALTRLATNWTIDDPGRMRSLRFGDSISRGGVGGVPLHFGGVQLARNFAVQPGFVTMPLPSVRGSAAVPSVVDIYVNDTLAGRRDVPPGPFELTDVPIVTGNGDVQLVVRDLLGRETLYRQSYYAAPHLLRKGLHDYSYEAGFLRRSFGRESNDYGALMLSATHRYGFTDKLTGEAHAVATREAQSAGAAASLALSGVGQLQGSIAASRSGLGDGAMASFGLERRSGTLSLGVQAEMTTANYKLVGWSEDRRAPASTVQAFAGLPLDFGSLGISYLRRDGRGEPDVEFLSTNASLRLGRFGNLHVAGRKSLRGDKDLAAELFFTLPIGPRTSVSSGASLANGSVTFNSAQQRNLPVGDGFGYRVAASTGAIDRLDGKLGVQTGFGTYDAQLSWTDGKAGARLSATGGLGMVDRRAFASRQLNQSFATVKVGDYPDVRIYADNQLVGRTNRSGIAVVPRLRPFDRNALRIELADLPWDAEVTGEERSVRPYDRHGVSVDFAVKPARAAIVRILLEDGTPLPPGAIVRVGDEMAEFVSAPGGEVYMTGLEPENTAVASWSTGECELAFRYSQTGDPQPRLGDVQCRSRAR